MSSNDTATYPETARFTLWPLPKLGLATSDGEPGLRYVETAPNAEQLAYERGVEDGRAALGEELSRDVEHAVKVLSTAAEGLEAERLHCAKVMEDQVLVLGVAVARDVIQREVTTDQNLVGEMVRRAINEVTWDSPVVVSVHPRDLETVGAYFAGLEHDAKPRQLEWVADETVQRGGYKIDTLHRIIDGALNTILENLYQHIADE